jgi:uridylate kinase
MQKKRVLLKLSGESFKGSLSFGQDIKEITRIATDIVDTVKSGVEVCIVIGGGNIFRGSDLVKNGFDKVSSDYIGMLATVMNALTLQGVLEGLGAKSKVFSSVHIDKVCTPYCRSDAIEFMQNGYINIFAAGTGNPFVTTDTAAVIKALEMRCDLLLKGTQVNGVYDADPKTHSNAKKIDTISYKEVLDRELKIMDFAAISIASEQKIPICVFSIGIVGELLRVVTGKGNFTLIK